MHLRICLALLGSAVVIAGLAGMLAAVIMHVRSPPPCWWPSLEATSAWYSMGVSDGSCSTKATSDQM